MPRLGSNGGLMGPRRVSTTSNASGSWLLDEQCDAQRAGIWPSASGDPYWDNVSLLLHMDGSNGSTTFTDSSSNALTVTASDNAQISTARSKFGGSSLLLDGLNDFITTQASPALALGTGDFTVEFFVYRTSNNNDQGIFTFGATQSGLFASMDGSTLGVGLLGGDPSAISGGTLSLNTWHHVAITRSSGSLRGFIDGVQFGSTVTETTNLVDNVLNIGYSFTSSYPMVGNLDEFRVTKGIARYTANFTAPTAAFPDA
jgi:hypothetical protein